MNNKRGIAGATPRCRQIRSAQVPISNRVRLIRASLFGFVSDLVIRASSFLEVWPHDLFLVGARVSFVRTDETPLVEIN